MRFCIFCGVEIPRDAKYCQICGKEQPLPDAASDIASSVEQEEVAEPPTGIAKFLPQSPMAKIALVAGVFFALIGILTAIIILAVKK